MANPQIPKTAANAGTDSTTPKAIADPAVISDPTSSALRRPSRSPR